MVRRITNDSRRLRVLTGVLVLGCLSFVPPTAAAPRSVGTGAAGSETAAAANTPGGPKVHPSVERAVATQDRVSVFVRYRTHSARSTVVGLVRGNGGHMRRQFHLMPLVSAVVNGRALGALERSSAVVDIQLVHELRPADGDSGRLVHADDVHDAGWSGSGSTVAVLDTGIDANHPYFRGRLEAEACFSSSGTSLCPNGMATQVGTCAGCGQPGAANALVANCFDGTTNICDHGTHVAGIAVDARGTQTGHRATVLHRRRA